MKRKKGSNPLLAVDEDLRRNKGSAWPDRYGTGCEWCGMKTVEIARRLHRDPSMISRLCAEYERARDLKIEKTIASAIAK